MMNQKELNELNGEEARAFAEEHLQKVRVNSESWTVEYINPETNEKWLMDYPESEQHGGGSPRPRCRCSAAFPSGFCRRSSLP